MVQFKLSDFAIGKIGTKDEFNSLIKENKERPDKLFTPLESSLFLGASIKAYKALCAYFDQDSKNDFKLVADSLSRLFQILNLKPKEEHTLLIEQIKESSNFADESKKSMLISLVSGSTEEEGNYCIRFENCIKHRNFIFEGRKKENYVEVKMAIDGSEFVISKTMREEAEKPQAKTSSPNVDNPDFDFYLEQAMLMGFNLEEEDEGWDDEASSDSSSEKGETSPIQDDGYGTMEFTKSLPREIPNSSPAIRTQEKPGDEVLLGSSPTGYSGTFYMPELSPKASTITSEGQHGPILGNSPEGDYGDVFYMDL